MLLTVDRKGILMKKIICICLAAVILIGLLPGCSGEKNEAQESVDLTPIGPSGSVDTLAEDVRTYLKEAGDLYDSATPEELEKVKSPKKLNQSLYESKQPVQFQWSWDGKNAPADSQFAIQLSMTEDFAQYQSFLCTEFDAEVTQQSQHIWNLFTGTTYYWRVAATLADGSVITGDSMSFTTLAGPSLITIDGAKNARDMGGWEIAYDITLSDGTVFAAGTAVPQGRVYRTGRLEDATAEGMKTIKEELGLKMEVDLRSPNAVNEKANPVIYNSYVGVDSALQYEEFIENPEVAAPYLRPFTYEQNYPIAFHCHGGSDRAGSLAFILGALQGVSEADLIKNYEFSSKRLVQGAMEGKFRDFPAFLKAFHALSGDTPYEKARTFCLRAGLTNEEIDKIIHNMMGQ